ncbi:hypothetical protein [Sphingomonas sp.]|uniref:hypothetical protein n=1 Tax=Sphingomonas sp. TaxID=28214 RepID=UPI0025CCCDFB|nr:hypothetical protein [Sphingomonas sp.]
MTPSPEQHRERLATVRRTLESLHPVPTDTYITDDIPLLLTRLSQIPVVRERSGNR